MKLLACLAAVILLLCACGQPAAQEESATTAETTFTIAETTFTAAAATQTTQPTEPALVLHSGLREDGSFTEGTLFVGDSMTCILVEDYLTPKGLIGDAYYTAKYGARLLAYFDGTVMSYKSYNHCAFRPEHENCTYQEVAGLLGEKLTAIYIMFGTNCNGTEYADAYIELVDYLLETCPNATIHLQLIPDGNPYLVRDDMINPWIREAYGHYVQLGQPRVMLIDTHTAIGLNVDQGGTHLDETGNENWYNAIRAHAEANGLMP